MICKMIFCLVVTLTLSINVVSCSSINRPFPGEEYEYDDDVSSDDYDEEPVYRPRFLPIFGDNGAAIGKVIEAIQNPGNKTLQENLFNVVADVVLKNFGGDETLKSVIEVVKNSQNKTFQEIVMNVAAEVAISKFGGDDTIRVVANILKNPGNKTLQENLFKIAANVADSKLKSDGVLQKVVEVLQKPGNRTLQENLLNVVFEVSVIKFGDNEIIKSVAEVFKNSGNKTMQENLLNLATSVALTKFGNNPIIKLVATSIQNSGNATFNEKLETVADAALTAALGPVQAAIIKQGLGVAGQALKVGGSLLGGALTDIGGDSPLGKAGQAISNGTQMFGGLLSNFGGGDKGVGAAIEKFGESLKNKNVTVQEALKQSAGEANLTVLRTEENVNSNEETIKTSNKILDELDVNKTESIVESKYVESDSEEEHETQEVETSAKTKIEDEISKENNVPDDFEMVEEMEQTNTNSINEKSSEVKLEELTPDLENAPAQVDNKLIKSTAGFTDENENTSNNLGVDQPLKLEERPNETLGDDNQESKSEQKALGSQANSNKVGRVDQSTQIRTESTEDSLTGNTNFLSAENKYAYENPNSNDILAANIQIQSETAEIPSKVNASSQTNTKRYVGSYQSIQANPSINAKTTTTGNTYLKSTVDQSVSSGSSNPLTSAIDAIESAKQALQAGGDALGGALGSLTGGSSSAGSSRLISNDDGRTQGTAMNIEITQVRLQMP